jgi:hypothetical protein
MSYEVIGDAQSLGQFASNSGYADLIAAGTGSLALCQLFETGESSDVSAVITALHKIKSPPDVKETARRLAAIIAGQNSILISDGMTVDRNAARDKAANTARWAVTMTKVRIRQVLSRTRWQLVEFRGKAGGEAVGVVDLLAVRKDHGRPTIAGTKRGDALQIILIQVKGGSAARPTSEDGKRIWAVAKRLNARDVLLATWKRGSAVVFSRYVPTATEKAQEWAELSDLGGVFR